MVEIYATPEVEIELGRRGENLAYCILFNISGWEQEYGTGTVHLLHQRPGDAVPYPCSITEDGAQIRWEIDDADIANVGRGRAELQYYVDDVIVKSQIYHTRTFRALDEAGPVPDEPQKTWVEQVLAAAIRAEEATKKGPVIQDGTWWVWDAERGQYTDTGVVTSAVQSDYAQNDPASHSYIENRPFYEDEAGVHQLDDKYLALLEPGEQTDVIPEQDVAFAYTEEAVDYPAYFGQIGSGITMEEGKTYFVQWDGEVHGLVCRHTDALIGTVCSLGNLGLIFEAFENTGEEFVLMSIDIGAATAIYTSDSAASHTVRVFYPTGNGYTVRDQYLEGTEVARRVGELEGRADDLEKAVGTTNESLSKRLDGHDGTLNELDGRTETLEQQMADLLYEAIAISSFSHNAGTQEMGAAVTDVTLSWQTNKIPTALTLDGEAIDVNLTSKALSGLSITKDSGSSWTLKATDERGASATKSTGISFLNGVYYGAAAEPSAIDSAFVLGLTKTLTSTRARSVTVDAADGLYIWYCLPVRLGACAFTVGGFEGGFNLVDTIEFTNASGYAESYYVYRSSNASLGSTKVVVS